MIKSFIMMTNYSIYQTENENPQTEGAKNLFQAVCKTVTFSYKVVTNLIKECVFCFQK